MYFIAVKSAEGYCFDGVNLVDAAGDVDHGREALACTAVEEVRIFGKQPVNSQPVMADLDVVLFQDFHITSKKCRIAALCSRIGT